MSNDVVAAREYGKDNLRHLGKCDDRFLKRLGRFPYNDMMVLALITQLYASSSPSAKVPPLLY